jgi:hypothetical protein
MCKSNHHHHYLSRILTPMYKQNTGRADLQQPRERGTDVLALAPRQTPSTPTNLSVNMQPCHHLLPEQPGHQPIRALDARGKAVHKITETYAFNSPPSHEFAKILRDLQCRGIAIITQEYADSGLRATWCLSNRPAGLVMNASSYQVLQATELKSRNSNSIESNCSWSQRSQCIEFLYEDPNPRG